MIKKEEDSHQQHPQEEEFHWREGGWTIQTRRSKILNNDSNSLQFQSHLVWKNELGMTKFANQDLPEALWGSNCLALHHDASNTTIYVCALEALRAWLLLDEPPIPHKSGRIPDAWDYTFTTPYAGSVCRGGGMAVTEDMIQPDGSTVVRAPAENLVTTNSNSVQLRPPLCKCVGGRMLCAGVARNMDKKKNGGKKNGEENDDGTRSPSQYYPPLLPVEKWEQTDEVFDMKCLLRNRTKNKNTDTAAKEKEESSSRPPRLLHYSKPIFFWLQNLDPQSYSFFMGHVAVGTHFLVASLRCFVRVNGVRVRLLGTQFIIRSGGKNNEVLRERSWREGTWAEYTGLNDTGVGSDQWIDLGTDLEQIERASRRLRHKYPPIVEKLVLPKTEQHQNPAPMLGNLPTSTKTATTATTPTVWAKQMYNHDFLNNGDGIGSCYCSSKSGGIILLVKSKVMALDSHSGAILWERNLDCCGADGLLLLSVEQQSKVDGSVLVGDDQGGVHILEWPDAPSHHGSGRETKNDLQSFYFRENKEPRNGGDIGNQTHQKRNNRVQISSSWVERVAWSENGRYFAAAAGRNVMINGETIMEMEGTVYGISFLSNNQQVAIAIYGTLILASITDPIRIEIQQKFNIGASALLACAVSQDANSIAIGCLDKRVRVFQRTNNQRNTNEWSAREDWVGFDGRVSALSWSSDNHHLAALGGSSLLVTKLDLKPGEAPVLCSYWPNRSTGNSTTSSRFKTFLWGKRANMLMASTDRSLHIFDIHATNDMVLKRCYPIQSIPIEKGESFVATNNEEEVLIWGRSNIRKVKVG